MYNKDEINIFFNRLNINDCWDISVENLYKIHKAFTYTIPYETLDPLNLVEIKLDEASLYNKMVLHKRGGYCFEVNALLSRILKSIGYIVNDHLAWVLPTGAVFEDEGIPQPRHHVLSVVFDEDVYLADVGFGRDGLVEPIKIKLDTPVKIHYRDYVLEKDSKMGIRLVYFTENQRTPLFAFRLKEKRFYGDFTIGNYYCNYKSGEFFTEELMVSKSYKEGKYFLFGNELKIIERKKTIETIPITQENLNEMLIKYFDVINPYSPKIFG